MQKPPESSLGKFLLWACVIGGCAVSVVAIVLCFIWAVILDLPRLIGHKLFKRGNRDARNGKSNTSAGKYYKHSNAIDKLK